MFRYSRAEVCRHLLIFKRAKKLLDLAYVVAVGAVLHVCVGVASLALLPLRHLEFALEYNVHELRSVTLGEYDLIS